MLPFEKQFDIPGMIKLDGIAVETAVPLESIKNNILKSKDRFLNTLDQLPGWREQTPIAIVGGGPSLKVELDNLTEYKYVLACGSVHDYLIENGVIPTWCAVCDPDPIVINYLQKLNPSVKYLIASQCAPEVFEHLKGQKGNILLPGAKVVDQVYMWHLMGDKFDHTIYGEGAMLIGGGCTILTRAMVIAMGMGFYNLHLFGCDTSLGFSGEHHAYDWSDSSKEKIYDETEVQFEVDGPKFKVAGYHLGQLFDIKALCRQYANRMQITVHGDSLLSYFMELAQKRLNLKKEWDLKNGTITGLNGLRNEPVRSEQSIAQS